MLILIWVRLILIHMPAFIILEEVKPFLKEGLPLLMQPDMLGSSCTFTFGFLDPRFFNLPVSRPRMYCILTRTCSWSLSRSLDDLRSTFPPLVSDRPTCGLDYFFGSRGSDGSVG